MGKKVIIVGNGASLLDMHNGSLIDAFDVVVRINDFKTIGYELYTGKKTDILFTCRLDMYNSLEKISQFPEVITCLLMNPYHDVVIAPEVLASPNIKDNINWKHVDILRDLVGMSDPRYPSTGLICIDYMIRRYGHVFITGFDNFKAGNRHYYEEGRRMDPSPHSPTHQRLYLQQLEKRGVLARV